MASHQDSEDSHAPSWMKLPLASRRRGRSILRWEITAPALRTEQMLAVESPDSGACKKQRGEIEAGVIGENYARHLWTTRLTVRHFE
jgi:hypothetical protein